MPNLEYRYRQRTHDQYQTNGSHGVGQNVYASAHTMPIRPSVAPTTAAAPMTSPHVFRHHISQPALAHINGAAMGGTMPRDRHGRSVPSLRPIGVSGVVPDSEADAQMQATDVQMLSEARNLRLHQQRLEQRSRVLEEQNRQLQMQLERLQKMVEKVSNYAFKVQDVPFSEAPVPPTLMRSVSLRRCHPRVGPYRGRALQCRHLERIRRTASTLRTRKTL